ncbi:MAG: hypothetical protein WBW04_16665 [Nitrolancea sp.]
MKYQEEDRLSTADVAGMSGTTEENREERNVNGEMGAESGRTPLFPADQAESFRSRWTTVQSGFVDEPRRAVEQADSLIAEVMKSLASSFAEERQALERQWDSGDDVSTEDLRVGLQRYRSFFDRLLSV